MLIKAEKNQEYVMASQLTTQDQQDNPQHQRTSSLLFVGVLMFATLVVPGIALTTQWAMEAPASDQVEAAKTTWELSAAEQETLSRYRHKQLVQNETGSSGRTCSASAGLGADSIFTGLCSETAN
jgi:hypothetical protein